MSKIASAGVDGFAVKYCRHFLALATKLSNPGRGRAMSSLVFSVSSLVQKEPRRKTQYSRLLLTGPYANHSADQLIVFRFVFRVLIARYDILDSKLIFYTTEA